MKKITIVVVAFNRPSSLERLLDSLDKIILPQNKTIDLHISIDRRQNDKNNDKTIDVANNHVWKYGKKIVDVKNENFGLKKHVLYCGNLTNKYDNIIVLEDDLVVSPQIIQYAEQAIDCYLDNDNIAGIGLYSFQRNPLNSLPFYPIDDGSDVYYMQYACSWGQIWSRDKWMSFYTWYEKNKDNNFDSISIIPEYVKKWGDKSWLKYHIYYCILNNKFFVYPQKGLSTNFTDLGTHNLESNNAYQCEMFYNNKLIDFKFSKFEDSINKYDSFFENINLNNFINVEGSIMSNIFGQKKDLNKYHYMLSTKKYDYEVVSSYALQMYPYEYNLLYNIEGQDIFLYDLSIEKKNHNKQDKYKLFKYLFKFELISSKNLSLTIKNNSKILLSRLIRRKK